MSRQHFRTPPAANDGKSIMPAFTNGNPPQLWVAATDGSDLTRSPLQGLITQSWPRTICLSDGWSQPPCWGSWDTYTYHYQRRAESVAVVAIPKAGSRAVDHLCRHPGRTDFAGIWHNPCTFVPGGRGPAFSSSGNLRSSRRVHPRLCVYQSSRGKQPPRGGAN